MEKKFTVIAADFTEGDEGDAVIKTGYICDEDTGNCYGIVFSQPLHASMVDDRFGNLVISGIHGMKSNFAKPA